MQDGPVLRRVDSLAAKHRVDALAQSAGVRQVHEEPERRVRDAVLRVVEVQARPFDREALAARWIVSKEQSQVNAANLLEVSPEGVPGWKRGQW